MEEVKTILTNS